ncbi:MAG TPA: hypothetical protein VJ256_03135, partial [Dehalococcoidia bacterium]|nr:hypothetical protein [Dehalococcoidia bacterium]
AMLKAMDLYIPYKGPGKERRAARGRILEEIEKGVPLFLPQPGLLSVIVGDPGGDALDSVVAASAAFRAIRRPDGLVPKGHAAYALEGYVYM